MPLQQLFLLALASMVALAVLRVVRVHLGRAPHPEGIAKLLFGLAFVFLPPIALGALTDPGGGSTLVPGLPSVPIYALMLLGLLIVTRVAGAIAAVVAPRRLRRVLALALAGSEGDPYDVPFNPPVTTRLAAIVALVDRRNSVFPRGAAFRDAIEGSGFRDSWVELDTATGTLEGAMAEDYRLGRGVASAVADTARDARSRLDTLRQFAVDAGQSWVTA